MTNLHHLTSGLLAAAAIGLAAAIPESHAAEMPLSRAKMIIEFNATANDVGVQVLLDGEPWKRMRIFKPNGIRLLDIIATNSLNKQGLTELFFESSEPNLAELSLDDFLARFPEGIYEFEGVDIDGIILEGDATFTHVIPAGPVVISPPAVLPLMVINPNNFDITWEPVTDPIRPDLGPVTIGGYQVIVEQVAPLRVLLIDLPVNVCTATLCSVQIPSEFFVQPNTLHKFEVLVIETGGNQTITSGEFLTPP